MSNISKLTLSLCIAAFVLLVGSIVLYNQPELGPEGLSIALSLSAGFLGILGAMVGFASSSDKSGLF
jgi:hypothetical protein